MSLLGQDKGQWTGVLNKLERWAVCARRHDVPIDFHAVLPGGEPASRSRDDRALSLVRVPYGNAVMARVRQVRLLAGWLRRYDRVVLRYPSIDPACLLGIRDRRRIVLEHHAKEGPHLRLLNDPRWPLEAMLGGWWIRGFAALTAVTPDILDYERARARFRGPTACFPNTIPVDLVHAPDAPVRGEEERVTRIALVFAKSFPWGVLEEVIASFATMDPSRVELHLVGRVDPSLRRTVASLPQVKHREYIPIDELEAFYGRMHLGLGHFGGPAQRALAQLSPLRVREYLAHGLPVAVNYDDPALPQDFPYRLVYRDLGAEVLEAFVDSIARHSRASVRAAARPFIDAETALPRMYAFYVGAHPNEAGPAIRSSW